MSNEIQKDDFILPGNLGYINGMEIIKAESNFMNGSLTLTVAPPNPTYVMGIDPHGYDGVTGSICVIRKDNDGSPFVEYLNTFRDKNDYEREVKAVATYYNIPENNIFKEV